MRINCKFSIDYLLSCAFLCHISILVFFLRKFVDLWSRGHLITPQELATMIIPKGELTSLFDSVKRAGFLVDKVWLFWMEGLKKIPVEGILRPTLKRGWHRLIGML